MGTRLVMASTPRKEVVQKAPVIQRVALLCIFLKILKW